MKLRVVAIILLLSLLLFFGFKKVSSNKNKAQSTNIEQLNILKYAPENNKLLFISNFDSLNIVNQNEKDKNPKNQDNFVLIKDSILNYLGIDLGNNKLEDIYNNELIISTFENNKRLEDDILIVFKIKCLFFKSNVVATISSFSLAKISLSKNILSSNFFANNIFF